MLSAIASKKGQLNAALLAVVASFILIFTPSVAEAQVTVSLDAPTTVSEGGFIQLDWLVTSVSGNSSCTASSSEGDWIDNWTTPPSANTGIVSMSNITTTRNYILACTDGPFNDSAMVTVTTVNDSCTLSGDPLTIVIPIGENLRSSVNYSQTEGSLIPTDLPAGVYQVELEAYDGANNRSNLAVPQPNEGWKLRFIDGDSPGVDVDSAVTPDLADDVNFIKTSYIVNDDNVNAPPVFLKDTVTTIQAIHGQQDNFPTPTANSHDAVCAAVTAIDKCTLSGDYIISMPEYSWLRADGTFDEATEPEPPLAPLAENISIGAYTLELEGYDGGSGRGADPDDQIGEIWFMRFLDGGGVGK